MSLTEMLELKMKEELDDVARVIEREMKDIVLDHDRSGAALAAIHIEKINEYSVFVGGTDGTGTGKTGTDHLKMLNDGNGTGGIPKRGKPKRPMPMTYSLTPKSDPFGGYAMKAKNYPGIHFVEEIANRHR